MVLQRGKTNLLWGWAEPGERVQVKLGETSTSGTTGPDGRWQVRFMPPTGLGPYTVEIAHSRPGSDAARANDAPKSSSQTTKLHDVLVGDVWLCGGQSNMELPLGRTRDAEAEISAADRPQIRFFIVKSHPAYSASTTLQGTWKVCSPKTVTEDGGLSAVAYYFARKVQSATNIPIGLIQDCLGGTPAESWTSPQTLRKMKDFDAGLDEVERLRAKGSPEYGNYISHWYDEYDIGRQGRSWAAPDLDDKNWKAVTIPGGFADLGAPDNPAVCYFRKQVTLPDPLPSGAAAIRLGVIERMDTTEINGKWVGASAWVENPRVYSISEGVLKPGRNVISVRVFKTKANGGFQSPGGDLKLVLGDKSQIPLAGEWKGKLSVDARPPHPLPIGFENWPTMPSVLYNGMIAPLAPLALTGAIWYQGEANTSRAAQYRTLLPAMITDWRAAFGQGAFPFYIVSLPAFMQHRSSPGSDGWTDLRAAQIYIGQTVSNSDVAITVDTGDPNDIHPKDKLPVGERLALCALAKHYGRNIVSSGPSFKSLEQVADGVKIRFDHTEGGLVAKGGEPGEFAISGADGKWFWADARLDGDAVMLSSTNVAQPKAASYSWQANPRATLFNGAGLPAVPFRTDR
jgi:sialate O-acetylesterase